MGQYQNQFDMIGKMQMQQAQLDMMKQRQQGVGGSSAIDPRANDVN
jgi:hypothetical protein